MESELQTMRKTLFEVNALLELSENNPSDLVNLKADLLELIALKENELLDSKKEAALSEAASLITDSETTSLGLPTSLFSFLNDEELSNTRCSLPGWTSRGYYHNQNAFISEVIDKHLHEGVRSVNTRVRIYLVNPTRLHEVPCDVFLSTGFCPKESLCRFSHGIVVKIKDLKDWDEPKASTYFIEGQICLARQEIADIPVWHHARLQHTDMESGTCVVEWFTVSSQSTKNFVHTLTRPTSYSNLDSSVTSLPLTHVHPITHLSDNSGNDRMESSNSIFADKKAPSIISCEVNHSFMESTESLNNISTINGFHHTVQFTTGGTLGKLFETNNTVGTSNTNICDNEPLGAWENHTRGIGSTLLKRMGYTGEGGLGRNGSGRRLPVCMDKNLNQIILDAKGLTQPTLDKFTCSKPTLMFSNRQLKRKKKTLKKTKVISNSSVFDFINSKVLPDKSNSHIPSNIPNPTEFANSSQRTVKIKIYNIQREISSVKLSITKTREMFKQNKSRDRKVTLTAETRLKHLSTSLHMLEQKERTLTAQLTKKKLDEKRNTF